MTNATTTPTTRRRNTFRQGSATFRCRCCKRLTRETGVQSLGSQLCPQCFDLSGIENDISDGHSTAIDNAAQIKGLTSEIAAKGGSLTEWRDMMRAAGLPATLLAATAAAAPTAADATLDAIIPFLPAAAEAPADVFTWQLSRADLKLVACALTEVAADDDAAKAAQARALLVRLLDLLPR